MKHLSEENIRQLVIVVLSISIGVCLGIAVDIIIHRVQMTKAESLIQSSINLINLVDSDIDDFEDIYGETDEYQSYQEAKAIYYNEPYKHPKE